MDQSHSHIDRFLSKQQPLWVRLLVSLILLLLPFAVATFDGFFEEFVKQGIWRFFLLPPIVILYIWLISPSMSHSEAEVLHSIRPLVPLDDEDFARLVDRESRINPRYQWLTFGIGAILGLISAQTSGFNEDVTFLYIYWFLAMSLMYGLLAWVILAAIASTRFNSALHSQPLRIDILNPGPFEAIGRQSLLMALVFIGGITLSFLLSFSLDSFSSPLFWISYLLLVLITVLIFFFNMRPTHLALAAAKQRELEPLQQHINASCRELVQQRSQKKDSASLSAEINALVAYEERLLAARTWPYNTSILRTLFFSVFIPLGSVSARLLVEVFFR
jgi:hypothetical protein